MRLSLSKLRFVFKHTRSKLSDFNVLVPLRFTPLLMVNTTDLNNSVDGSLTIMRCIHLQHYHLIKK